MMESWYIGVDPKKINFHPAPIPAGIPFKTDEPKRELMEQVVNNHIAVEDIAFDINYLPAGVPFPDLPQSYKKMDDYLKGFIAVSAPGVSFFRHVSGHNSNVAWVRIKNIPGQDDAVVSVVVDRWHDNVQFLFKENLHLDPSKDGADFINGFIGSYPNQFVVVDALDLPDFFDILDNYDGSENYIQRLDKYTVNRAEKDFWEVYDWFQEEFYKSEKQRGGLIDLNRYFHLAFEQ